MATITPPRWRFGLVLGGRKIADLVFPPACAFCQGELLEEDRELRLCGRCVHTLAPLGVARCPRCGLRIPGGLTRGEDCESCRGNCQSFEAVWTLGEYEDLLRGAALRGKRPEGQELVTSLSRLAFERHGNEIRDWRPDLIVPTPMHWLRRTWRGANSPEIVAEAVATALKVPYARFGLRRQRFTKPQAGLPQRERRSNVRGAFRVNAGYDFQDARVLLVDDILTTGATLGEMGRVARVAGASAVAVLVLARASGDW